MQANSDENNRPAHKDGGDASRFQQGRPKRGTLLCSSTRLVEKPQHGAHVIGRLVRDALAQGTLDYRSVSTCRCVCHLFKPLRATHPVTWKRNKRTLGTGLQSVIRFSIARDVRGVRRRSSSATDGPERARVVPHTSVFLLKARFRFPVATGFCAR